MYAPICISPPPEYGDQPPAEDNEPILRDPSPGMAPPSPQPPLVPKHRTTSHNTNDSYSSVPRIRTDPLDWMPQQQNNMYPTQEELIAQLQRTGPIMTANQQAIAEQ